VRLVISNTSIGLQPGSRSVKAASLSPPSVWKGIYHKSRQSLFNLADIDILVDLRRENWGRKNDEEEEHYLCTAYSQSDPEHHVDSDTVAKQNKQRRDATRKNVREAQKQGEHAIKVLDAMEAQEEAAEAAKAASHLPEASDLSSDTEPDEPLAAPVRRPRPPQIPTEAEPDDEPDYDELRRTMQRKQREGNAS
jgi:hypothetical protein